MINHDRLEHRDRIEAILVAETGLHVGSGRSGNVDAGGTDMPVIRDGGGRPFIPGSSFRGAFRSALESLLRGLGLAVTDPHENTKPKEDTADGQLDEDVEVSCPIGQLFGTSRFASRLRVADMPIVVDSSPLHALDVRHGVGLDRDLRTARQGVLYDFETVTPGTRFQMTIDIENATDAELGLVLTGLDLVDDGFVTIGGKASRGLGRVQLADLKVLRRTAADFLGAREGSLMTEDALDRARSAARAHYYVGEM